MVQVTFYEQIPAEEMQHIVSEVRTFNAGRHAQSGTCFVAINPL